MKIIPIASDSLGVRSLAVQVETQDCTLCIDPSAALGPQRYGLPPHQSEFEALFHAKQQIAEIATNCDILIVSHYHYDHYDPDEVFYTGKTVYAKDITQHINASQKERGTAFRDRVKHLCDLQYCDASTHRVGHTTIQFSPPFFHGPSQVRLGYVLMTTVDDGDHRLLHASDVQGPVTKEATQYIIDQHPDLVIMDGPPTLFLGWKFSMQNLQDASDNLVRIIDTLKGCTIILDHHLLRDLRYKKVFAEPYQRGGKNIKTFAEYLGKENNTLEARRKELWKSVKGYDTHKTVRKKNPTPRKTD